MIAKVWSVPMCIIDMNFVSLGDHDIVGPGTKGIGPCCLFVDSKTPTHRPIVGAVPGKKARPKTRGSENICQTMARRLKELGLVVVQWQQQNANTSTMMSMPPLGKSHLGKHRGCKSICQKTERPGG
jgi:hypothetical protein